MVNLYNLYINRIKVYFKIIIDINFKFINSDDRIYKLLKEYRLKTSKEESLKPYMIFNNEELNSLLESKPSNKEELLKIRGFGPKKVEKY